MQKQTKPGIGFICQWENPPEKTWSYTPWKLKQALSELCAVEDVSPEQVGFVTRQFLKTLNLRYKSGEWFSQWRESPELDWIFTNSSVAKWKNKQNDLSAVIQIGAVLRKFESAPLYTYQDVPWVVMKKYIGQIAGMEDFPGIPEYEVGRRIQREQELYRDSKGVFAMSDWMKKELLDTNIAPAEKIFPIYAGTNAVPDAGYRRAVPHKENRKRLLFVGKEFHRKGGDLVIQAFQLLRKEYNSNLSLTIVGPEAWPMSSDIPDGVAFLGRRELSEIREYFATHDMFVMPSRFEAFGIVFVEALAHGLPCIGRNAFAMPEMIKQGENGELVQKDDIQELADKIVRVLESDQIYENCAQRAKEIVHKYSWNAVSHRVLEAVSSG